MLVNGTRANVKDLDKLIEQLNALPSGFQSRNINPTSVSYNSQSEGYQYNQDGITAYNKWQSSKDAADLETALEAFKKAADASLRENNLPARANDLSNYGQVCRLAGRSEQGMPALEEAIKIHEQQGHVDNLYRDLGNLHASLLDVIQGKQNDGLTEEADQLRARLRPLRQSSANLISRNKGETINPEAHRVEQGEIGLSSDKPIGTDNVNDCVCVVLRDPHTKKTAIAHIDASTGISSLQVLLDRMPDRKPPDKPLEARLIGARFRDDPNEAMPSRISEK
jgi:tetratricopeptide (TPR) repeat protein